MIIFDCYQDMMILGHSLCLECASAGVKPPVNFLISFPLPAPGVFFFAGALSFELS